MSHAPIVFCLLLTAAEPAVERERALALRREAERHPTKSESDIDAANRLWADALAAFERSLPGSPPGQRARDLLSIADIHRHLRAQGIDIDYHRLQSRLALDESRRLRDPTDAESLTVVGKVLAAAAWLDDDKPQYLPALHFFDRVVNLDKSKPICFLNRGRTQYRAVAFGRHSSAELDEARDDLRRVADWQSARPVERGEAHFYLGEVELFRRNYRDAEFHFREAYQLFRDQNVRWVLWSFYRRGQTVLDWYDHTPDLPAEQQLPDAAGHLEKIAAFFHDNHHFSSESDWLRGRVRLLERKPEAAAQTFARYLPGWPDEPPRLTPEPRDDARLSLARVRFLVDWLDLVLRHPELLEAGPLSAKRLHETAEAVARTARSPYNADAELRARALAVAGLTQHAASRMLPANDPSREQYRETAVGLLNAATELVHVDYPGSWRWRLDLVRIHGLSDRAEAERLLQEAQLTAPKAAWTAAAKAIDARRSANEP